MPSNVHSLFPASSASRLLACPGSYSKSLAVEAGGRRASVYSAEGTLAHLVAETMLNTHMGHGFFLGRTYEVDGFLFTIDQEFLDAVSLYVDYVENLKALGYQVWTEQVVTPDQLWRDLEPLPIALFGTCDCIAFHPEWQRMSIVDLKFGKNVPVSPANNPQLLYYAAGAMGLTGLIPTYINLVVIQPRLQHGDGPIRMWVTEGAAIKTWARDTLYAGVHAAVTDNGQTLNPGPQCQWCPALLTCEAPKQLAADMATQMLLEAEDRPADPSLPDPLLGIEATPALTDQRLLEILDVAAIIEPLIEQARGIAKERLAAGGTLPGWELASRKGKRDWSVVDGLLFLKLTTEGFDPLEAATLKTPAALEREYPAIFHALESYVEQGAPVAVLQRAERTRRRTKLTLIARDGDDSAVTQKEGNPHG